MTDEALRIGALCLRSTLDVARSHNRVLDGDLVLVWTAVPGEGGVLVGPSGAVLYLAPSLSMDDGVRAFRSGARTPRELFEAFDEARPTLT
ncbi:MAG: hypothetical protein H7269_08685 [Cellulomonas sp.]|nr:hypothetical protein [Cellulomonas sp.]